MLPQAEPQRTDLWVQQALQVEIRVANNNNNQTVNSSRLIEG